MRRFIVLAVAMVVGWSVLQSCKSPDSSNVKSLDNFARGQGASLSVNACQGEFGRDFELYWGEAAGPEDRIQVDSPNKEAMKPAIKTALTAVPDDLQDWFFDKGGRLIFSTQAATLCTSEAKAKNMLTESTQGYAGCWRMDDGKFPEIIINADPAISRLKFESDDDVELLKKEIEHTVLRSFGYVVSEVLSKLKPAQEGEVSFEIGAGDSTFQTDRELLAWKFITDVRKHKQNGNAAVDLGIYGAFIQDQAVLDPNTSYEEAWRKWFIQYKSYDTQTQEQTPKLGDWADKGRRFQDYVFAETFDSYYCNPQTRAQLDGDSPIFQYTGNHFVTVIAPALEQAFAEHATANPEGNPVAKEDPAVESDAKIPAGPGEWDESSAEGAGKIETAGGQMEAEGAGKMEGSAAGLSPDEAPMEMKSSGYSLTGLRYPVLAALFAVRGALRYTASAVATWARNRNARASSSLIRGQPIRNALRIANGGPAGWRAERWRQTGGFQPIQRAQRGCLVRRWRC